MFRVFGVFIYDFLFFALPIAAILFFGISLYRYRSAISQNRKIPQTFPPAEIKKRLIMLIVSSVIMGIMLLVVIGYIALIFMVIAYM